MTDDRIPRIRRAAIPEDAVIVVRGEERLEVSRRLAGQFRDRFPDWERWGLSGFYARNAKEVDDFAYDQLQKFGTLRVYSLSLLIEAGFDIVPTFRTPHVTVAWRDELEGGLARLDSADHDRLQNP